LRSIIVAIVKSSLLKENLEKIKGQFCCPLEYGRNLLEYENYRRKMNVGLILLESEIARNLSDKERLQFYGFDCPKIILSYIGNGFYSFPVEEVLKPESPGKSSLTDFVKIVNEHFRPLPSENLSAVDDGVQFITRNPQMLQILENARKVAALDAHVLILGESGTGKDVLAQLIHLSGKRRERQMIKLNCAAIPSHLLESEMFGYRRGAFTGAFEDKIGKIRLANGSTIFLNEIGEMELSLQAKLLRVIETGEVDVLGDTQPVHVNVRVISATNRDLREAIETGKFRQDLYYRLNVVSFHLLPLRDRPEDLEPLSRYFISYFNKKYNKKIASLGKSDLVPLAGYRWPGNVRELRNFIERLTVQADGKKIARNLIEKETARLDIADSDSDSGLKLQEYMESQERRYIHLTLARNNYKIQETANDLGINRVSLFRKLRKYGIDVKNLKSSSGN